MKTAIFSYINNFSAKRAKRVVLESGWIVAGQIATIIATLVLVHVLTQYLSPAQYGQLALILTISVLVNQLIFGGVGNSIGRYYSIAVEQQQINTYFKASEKLLFYSSLAALWLGGVSLVIIYFRGSEEFFFQIIAVLIFAIASGVNLTIASILNAARQRKIVAIHTAADGWLKIGLVLLTMFFFRKSIAAILICYSISSIIFSFTQLSFLRRIADESTHPNRADTIKWMKKIWHFAWPFCAWGIFIWGQQVSDRWALERFTTTAEVGQYAVLFQLGYVPITILTGLVVSYLTPILYQRSGSGTDEIKNASVHRLSWLITSGCVMVTIIAFVASFFLHQLLFDILVAPAFRSASRYLPWVVVAGGLFAAGQMLGMKLMAELKPAHMLKGKIITALIGIFCNFYGAWKFGMIGVLGALVIFSLVHLLWMAALAKRLEQR